MPLIDRTDQGSEGLGILYQNAVGALAERLLDDTEECVIFLGAGSSVDANLGIPAGKDLARELADRSFLDWHEAVPLATISFYFEALRGRAALNRFLKERLNVAARQGLTTQAPPTLRTLLDIIEILEQRHRNTLIITTNYDQLLEAAYRVRFGRDLEVLVYRGGVDSNMAGQDVHSGMPRGQEPQEWRPRQLTCLFKMHGCISEATADDHDLVITEEDYINFISNMQSEDPRRRLPTYVSARIKRSLIAFVGYSLLDWNFRVLFKATAERTRHDRYAIQYLKAGDRLTPQDVARRDMFIAFWEKKGVKIINADAADVMLDLLEQVRSRAGGNAALR